MARAARRKGMLRLYDETPPPSGVSSSTKYSSFVREFRQTAVETKCIT